MIPDTPLLDASLAYTPGFAPRSPHRLTNSTRRARWLGRYAQAGRKALEDLQWYNDSPMIDRISQEMEKHHQKIERLISDAMERQEVSHNTSWAPVINEARTLAALGRGQRIAIATPSWPTDHSIDPARYMPAKRRAHETVPENKTAFESTQLARSTETSLAADQSQWRDPFGHWDRPGIDNFGDEPATSGDGSDDELALTDTTSIAGQGSSTEDLRRASQQADEWNLEASINNLRISAQHCEVDVRGAQPIRPGLKVTSRSSQSSSQQDVLRNSFSEDPSKLVYAASNVRLRVQAEALDQFLDQAEDFYYLTSAVSEGEHDSSNIPGMSDAFDNLKVCATESLRICKEYQATGGGRPWLTYAAGVIWKALISFTKLAKSLGKGGNDVERWYLSPPQTLRRWCEVELQTALTCRKDLIDGKKWKSSKDM